MAIGGLAITFLFLIPMERARGNGYTQNEQSFATALQETIHHPVDAINYIFASQSTAMVTTTALAVMDREQLKAVPQGRGSYTLAETILQPLPRQLVPGKPESIRNSLIQARWGIAAGHCVGLCPTYGPISPLMADGGTLAVLLGGLLLGMFMRWWYHFCFRLRSPLAKAAYAGTYLSFALIWWSSLTDLTVALLAIGIPLLWIDYCSRTNPKASAMEATHQTVIRCSAPDTGQSTERTAFGTSPSTSARRRGLAEAKLVTIKRHMHTAGKGGL
jgi:hypothetical protein